MHAASPAPGEAIGRWVIDRWVAAGATADVFKVHRADVPALVGALKLARDAAASDGIRAEGDMVLRLDHDGIVRLLDDGVFDERPFLVMTWADGRPLDALGRLPVATAAWVAVQLARALDHAHSRGLAHGDVKPGNVRVDAQARLLLLDLGSAAPAHTPTPLATTPRYAPPEWFGRIGADPRTADVYGVGVVLAELCTGAPAYSTSRLAELAEVKRAGPLVVEDLPQAVDALVRRCTAVDPTARPSMADVASALEGLAEEPAEALYGRTHHVARQRSSDDDEVDRYTLIGEIGRGGMGVVQLLWDERLARYVALKRPPPGVVDEARFGREARVLAQLDHPGIVRVLDIQRDGHGLFFTMEYIDGDDLGALVDEGPQAPARAARIVRDVARALHHAHDNGVIHRDIKPSNLLLDRAGHPRIVDFGLARPDGEQDLTLTREGHLLGTPGYMAPEQARGDEVTPAMDVYALGGVLYALLAGASPRGEHPSAEALWRVLEVPVPRLRAVRPDAPAELEAICAWAMAPEPAERPSAHELAQDLTRFLDGETVRARHLSLPVRAWRTAARHRRTLSVAAGVLLAVGLLGGGGYGVQQALALQADATHQAAVAARWHILRTELEATSGAPDDARFLAFVQDERTADSTARVEAWLWAAAQHAAAERHDDAVEAAARAWLEAGERDASRVVQPLFHHLVQAGRLDAAARLSGALAGEVDTSSIHADTLFLQRRLQTASALPGADGRLARALAQATRTDAPGGIVQVGGEGDAAQLLFVDGLQSTLVAATPELTERARWTSADRYVPLGGDELIRAGSPDSVRVRRAGQSWEELEVIEGVRVGLVEEDPQAPSARLLVQHAGPAGLYHQVPGEAPSSMWPALPTLGGEPEGLAVGDLDQDGTDEIVVNPGHWGAFEVWILEQDGDTVRPRTHIQPGYTPNLRVVHRGDERSWLAIANGTTYGSRRAFPDGSPFGWPLGPHLLELSDAGLERRHHVPMSIGAKRLFSGDLDGDGFDEVIVGVGETVPRGGPPATLIASTRPGGAVRTVHLRHLDPLQVADLDGDGDDELIVLDDETGAVWTLGAGTETLPAVPAEVAGDRTQRVGAAGRAETLARLGLDGIAAEEMLRLAPSAVPETSRALRERAAELLVRDRRIARAEEVLADIDSDAARAALAELQRRQGRLSALGERPVETLTFDGARLHPGIRVESPFSARMDHASGALDLLAQETEGPLLVLPVTDAEAIRVEVELTLTELDWGGVFMVALQDDDGRRVGNVTLAATGGARFVQIQSRCASSEGSRFLLRRPFETQAWPMTLILERRDGELRCALDDAEGVRHEVRLPLGGAGEPSAIALRGGGGRPALGSAAHLRLASIAVEGARLERGVSPDDPLRLLTEGDATRALEQLPEPSLARLVALEDAGRVGEARALLLELTEEELPTWLPLVLRTGRYAWLPTLEQRDASEAFEVWTRARGPQGAASAPRPTTDAELIDSLVGLAGADLRADLHGDAGRVLVDRAGALRRRGELARALRDLERAEELLAPEGPRRATGIHLERARLHALAGRQEAALDALERAMATSAVGQRVVRVVRQEDVFEALSRHPRWAAIVGED